MNRLVFSKYTNYSKDSKKKILTHRTAIDAFNEFLIESYSHFIKPSLKQGIPNDRRSSVRWPGSSMVLGYIFVVDSSDHQATGKNNSNRIKSPRGVAALEVSMFSCRFFLS